MLNILDKTVISVLHASDCKIPNLTLRDSSGYRRCEREVVTVLGTAVRAVASKKAHNKENRRLPVFYLISLNNRFYANRLHFSCFLFYAC